MIIIITNSEQKTKMFAKFAVFLTLFQLTDCYYNSSNQCSNYDFMLINEKIITNETTNETKSIIKENIEYYINKITKNEKENIQCIWAYSFISIMGIIYINFKKQIDPEIINEMYGFDPDLIN